MNKAKKLYLASILFLSVSLIFIALLVFIRIREGEDVFILSTRIFSEGLNALFFYLAYGFAIASLTLNIISYSKNNLIIQRASFFVKLYFIIILAMPFFTSTAHDYSHVSSFFVRNLLAIGFLLISFVIELFALKNVEDNIPSDILLSKYRIIVNIDYWLLLITGIIIITLSFIVGDFYAFNTYYLSYIPIYFIPALSLIFYIFNSSRRAYLSFEYFSLMNIVKSKFIYYLVSYLTVVRLGYFAYSSHSFYSGLKVLRFVLFLIFILIVVLNSFFPRLGLTFILAIIIITLFTFEMIGVVRASKDAYFAFSVISNVLDYIILLLVASPLYIYLGINNLILKQ